MSHAQFSPSSAHCWINCPASIAMEEGLPNTDSKDSIEGTAAHGLASYCLSHGKNAADSVGVPWHTFDDRCPEDKFVDEEMADNVQVYLDYVRNQGGELLVEQRVEFSNVIGVPEQFGTSDAIIYLPALKRVKAIDLKNGVGEKIYAKKNAQELLYLVGVLETFAELCSWEVDSYELAIVQPRLDHIDEWVCTPEELKEFIETIKAAAHEAKRIQAMYSQAELCTNSDLITLFNPDQKTCRWCKAKSFCPGATAAVAKEVFDDFQALDDPDYIATNGAPPTPIAARLGNAFGMIPFIQDWISAVNSEVERRVILGETIIGTDGQPLRLAEGRKGHRVWKDPQVAEGVITGLLPPEKAYKPRELITPSAADKLLKKKKTMQQWKDMVEPLITQPAGAPKVVLGSDPAPPYSGEAKADEFEVVTEE